MAEQLETTDGVCPELEEIAALVDGRLGAADRARIVDHLGICESCYEVFTGTVRFREEERRAEGRIGSVGSRWGLAAAAAAALAAGALLWWTWLPPLPATEIAGLTLRDVVARRTDDERARAVATAEPRWSYPRGGGAGIGSRRTAFRLGVLVVDLEVALRSDEPRRAETPLERLAYEETEELIDVFYAYEQVARGLDRGVDRRNLLRISVHAAAGIAERVRDDADEERLFALGSWAEAGRLAAVAGDARHFGRPEIGAFLGQAALDELPPEVTGPLDRVSDLLGGEVRKADLPALAAALDDLVVAGGNVAG